MQWSSNALDHLGVRRDGLRERKGQREDREEDAGQDGHVRAMSVGHGRQSITAG
jgi:hypothetical protein